MKRFIRKILNKFGYDIKLLDEYGYGELLSVKRYEPQIIEVENRPFKIPDSHSFYHSYQEIFGKGIYKFNSKSKNPHIIDCGANCGLSILYFKKLYPKSTIVAFEADPFIYEIAKQNIEQQKLENVTLHNLAVWNKETELTFVSERADGGRIGSDQGENTIKVKTTVLSKYLNQNTDLLKIDIEGAEYEVLREIDGNLNHVKNIFVEYHSFEGKKQNLTRLIDILEKNGFRIHIHTQYSSQQPLIKRKTMLGMDLQLNIFGYRDIASS